MKKRSLFLVVTLVAALFAGCVKDAAVESDGYVYKKGTVSFALPSAGKQVTYTRAAALAAEDEVASLLIYQFGEDKLEKVYATGNLSIDGVGEVYISGSTDANRVATINLGPDVTGAKKFYLVANVNGEGQVQSSTLASVALETTIGEFENGFVTDALEEDAVLTLATPLPMSNADAVEVDDVTAPGYQEVTLKRRVARFDIVNHPGFTNLTVTGVIVRKGNLSGEILDKTFSGANDGNGEKVLDANGSGEIDDTDYVDPAAPTLELNAAGLEKSLNAAQFYLYPTTVKANGSGTEILLSGMYRGIPHVYPLTLEDDVEIEANHVYQIVVNRPTTPVNEELFTFSLLKVAGWDDPEGDEIESGIVESVFSGLLAKNGTPLETEEESGEYDLSDASTADELEYRVEYQSTSALAPEVTLEAEDRGDGVTSVLEGAIEVEKETPVLTRAYGTVYYKHVITVKLTQPSLPVKATLTITDQELDEEQVYTLFTAGRYNGSATLKPVLVGGRYWAPVNCGATELMTDFSGIGGTDAMTPANTGYYYQWGRKTPFWDGAPTTDTQFSSIEEAGESNKFYTGGGYLVEDITPSTWPESQDPCPAGWHVPSSSVLGSCFSSIASYSSTALVSSIAGANGTFLYVPSTGFMTSNDVTFINRTLDVRYLAGNEAAGDAGYAAWYVHYDGYYMQQGTLSYSEGVPVRCVLKIL